MKSFLVLLGMTLATSLLAQSGSEEEMKPLLPLRALASQGNHREAADQGKALLAQTKSPALAAETLDLVVGQLASLGAHTEQETVIEETVARFPQDWQVLLRAGECYQGLPHFGTRIDNTLQRGEYRNQGQHASIFQRDRVRALQLLDAAREHLLNEASPADRARVLDALENALLLDGTPNAWALQVLTDLTQLPDDDAQIGMRRPFQGHPVDTKGQPVFFQAPDTWTQAQSDGERLFWIFQERRRLSAAEDRQVRGRIADLAASWFSVQTLDTHRFRWGSAEDGQAQRDGIAALHTLRDDETTARLATGVKRFTLPPEWAFLNLYQTLAEDAQAPASERAQQWFKIAKERRNRRQYDRAVEALQQALNLEPDANAQQSLRQQMDQITGNWAAFEHQESQPAGQAANLSLVFRNARKITFTARKVNVTQLLADTEAYLRSSPQPLNQQKIQLSNIGRNLLEENGETYLGEIAARWELELEPRANHWDKRVDVTTPLQDAGAWLIEGQLEGGHITRTLLWLERVVITQVPQKDGLLFLVTDAITGAPIPNTTLRFFGYRQEWQQNKRSGQRPRVIYHFKDSQHLSDANGAVKLRHSTAKDHEWIIRATTEDQQQTFWTSHAFLPDPPPLLHTEPKIYTITDRPVYRPGQEVKWKIWARAVGYDANLNSNPFAGSQLRIIIHDPRGEKWHEKTYQVDDGGAIQDVLPLNENATLGEYRFEITQDPSQGRQPKLFAFHSFRVEEYKKPEFEVKIEAPALPVALGDTFEIKVRADYYFGGPVKQGQVKYTLHRKAHLDPWFPVGRWDWLFGAGYGSQARNYEWYPGANRWCIPPPHLPWLPRSIDPPELIAEGAASLNADGTFTLTIDTALAKELHGDQDHRYEITAEVTDASRRTIFGQGSVLATRRPFEVHVSADRDYYQAGSTGEIRVDARTLDGRSVAATGNLRLLRITYAADGTPTETEVASYELLTVEEAVFQKVTWARSGQYRLSARLKDAAGHEIEGSHFVIVRGDGFNDGQDFRFDDLELLVEKETYAPGETVEITVQTNQTGSRVALFLRPQNGVYPDPIWLKLEGKSTTYRFQISEADQPNFFIEAHTIRNARVHSVTRAILVPPSQRIATLELHPDAATYQPGQGAQVKIRVKDQNGHPFAGQVVLTAYDKALEYISAGSNQGDIRTFFWGWKRDHEPQLNHSLRASEPPLLKKGEPPMRPLGPFGSTADAHLRETNLPFGRSRSGGGIQAMAAPEVRYDAVAASPAPVAAKAVMPQEADAPQPMIRSQLADSAVWVANFSTDTKGEGELNFKLPENLTTWKLRAWVLGPQTQVGEADVEVITRKDLLVRLQAPRFFVEKDEGVISANVHNELEVEQEVKAILELEGGTLEFIEAGAGTQKPRVIAAHSEQRFDWRVKAIGDGKATIRVQALAQQDRDAMEMTFPVQTHGLLKTDTWSLSLRPEQASGSLKLRIPAERNPEQSRLEVRWSPSLAVAMVDALPYLVNYPYGCTEQTLNRFVPTVITLNVLKKLGVDLKSIQEKANAPEPRSQAAKKNPVFDEAEVKKMAQTGLAQLESMQNPDGGWSWFPGGNSTAHMTALVLHGIKTAERAGLVINTGLLRSGQTWLKQYEAEQLQRLNLPPTDKRYKALPDNADALVHCVLVETGSGAKAMRDRLYQHRLKLSRYLQAQLGLACHTVGETDRRDMCLRNLRQFLKQDDENQTAWLELPESGWWYWYNDHIETQAAFLRLLITTDPQGETAARLAKYLVNNRRNGHYWSNTRDTASVIEALAEFVQTSGENQSEQTVEIRLDGQPLRQMRLTRDNLFSSDNRLILEGASLNEGEHQLEFRKLGTGPLYANAFLTVFSKEDPIPSAGLEIKVHRQFYRLTEEKTTQQVSGARGQVVSQQGTQYQRQAIASDTPIRSGDLIEVDLTIESKNDCEYVLIEDWKPAGFEPIEVRSGWSFEGLSRYQEYRDQKVAFFVENLPRGSHQLRYRVKAEIPGRFSALPARVEAMYAPDLRGNSMEWKARISD